MPCPEWMTGWWQGWGMHIHWLWAVPFVFIVAGAVCVLFLWWRAGPRYWHPHLPHKSFGHGAARQILDRRYASGEITQEQHAQMKRYLQQQGEGVKP